MTDKYEETVANLQNSLEDWSGTTVHTSESQLSKGILRSVLDTSSTVDQFATWLLAGAGATSVLLISNLDNISKFIGSLNYRVSLGFVCAAMVFGVLEKICSLSITIHRNAEKSGEKLAQEVLDAHNAVEEEIEKMAERHGIKVETEINIGRVFNNVIAAYPSFARNYLRKILLRILQDPMYAYKRSMRIYFMQTGFAALEVLMFILFVGSVVVGA